MAKLSPIGNDAQFINGIPANGAKLFTYASGSSTKQTTYTGEDGLTPQSNPIILDSRGEPSQPIWLTEGLEYKFVFASSTDTDPPSSPIWDIDNITGVNDASLTVDQWVISGITPTYINATTFTMPGDQTTEFQVNRRIKLSVTAGTVYGSIVSSAYAALTTITVQLDSGVLDAGLSSVSLGLITPTNTSLFLIGTSNIADDAITTDKVADNAITYNKIESGLFIQRGYISGMSLSTAGSSSTMSIAAGQATDSTNTATLTLTAIAKTTSAWAVGTATGGLDTGAIANSTWYYFYTILRTDTGVVDVIFSLSSSAPTLPANYTKYRYIGAGFTNGSAQWTSFTQFGNEFQWSTPIMDFSGANSTSAVTTTLSVPRGRKMLAKLNVYLAATFGNDLIYLSDLSSVDLAPSASAVPLAQVSPGAGNAEVWTNTSAQIRRRGAAATNVYIATTGWIDLRDAG